MRQAYDSIENGLMTGLVKGYGRRDRPRICWYDNIMAWTGLFEVHTAPHHTEGIGSLIDSRMQAIPSQSVDGAVLSIFGPSVRSTYVEGLLFSAVLS